MRLCVSWDAKLWWDDPNSMVVYFVFKRFIAAEMDVAKHITTLSTCTRSRNGNQFAVCFGLPFQILKSPNLSQYSDQFSNSLRQLNLNSFCSAKFSDSQIVNVVLSQIEAQSVLLSGDKARGILSILLVLFVSVIIYIF